MFITAIRAAIHTAVLATLACPPAPVSAAGQQNGAAPMAPASVPEPVLVGLINAYRTAPQRCAGRRLGPLPALDAPAPLSAVRLGTGSFVEVALERAGYASEQAAALFVTGADDADAAMAVLRDTYCAQLLAPQFSSVGAARSGAAWQVVLARPQPPLPDPGDAGSAVLAAVNAARSAPRLCGARLYAAAPPLTPNPALAQAAQAHSSDMAARRYFSHKAADGSFVSDRATRAGYPWRVIGENIASGVNTAQDAVAGWLDSPGHCANIMNPRFNEMGVAYAVNPERRTVYWTQVLGNRQ